MAAVATDPVSVLKALKAAGEASAKDIGTSAAYLKELASEGFVIEVGVLKTGKRGRPAATFKITKRGSDRVRRTK